MQDVRQIEIDPEPVPISRGKVERRGRKLIGLIVGCRGASRLDHQTTITGSQGRGPRVDRGYGPVTRRIGQEVVLVLDQIDRNGPGILMPEYVLVANTGIDPTGESCGCCKRLRHLLSP